MKTETKERDEETQALERRAETLRRHVDVLLTEADRRRHAATSALNVPLQVRRHPATTLSILGTVLTLAVAIPILGVRRARRRRSVAGRMRALREALGRMMKRPERVAESEPHLPKKVLTAALAAAASTVAKKQIERVFARRRGEVVLTPSS